MDGYHDENMLGPMASRVEYEDGGTMVLQRADLLQQLVLERSLPLQISKRFGDGKWYKGALTKVLADGTQFRVEYTDGDVELQSRSQVRGGFPGCCAGPVSSGAPKWEFPFWSRTRRPAAAAAAPDFCGGLLNRLTHSQDPGGGLSCHERFRRTGFEDLCINRSSHLSRISINMNVYCATHLYLSHLLVGEVQVF
jgi:hypothetical protein